MKRTLKITAALLLAIGVNATSVAMARDHATPETKVVHVSGSASPGDIAEGGTTVLPGHNATEVGDPEDHGDASNSGSGRADAGASGGDDGAGDHSGHEASGSDNGSDD